MEERRCGNYGKSSWDNDFIQRLSTPYGAKDYREKAEKLKNEVKILIQGTTDINDQLQLINDLQRLDVSHHFNHSIKTLLHSIYANDNIIHNHDDCHLTALKFRLLRQHGYHVSPEVFREFMDESGNFKAWLGDDVRALLSLYEASFLSMEGEPILDSANEFSTRNLTEKLDQLSADQSSLIRHALELPLHWRVQKLQARWFIHIYECRPNANLHLLEFAKLCFNMAQATYQEEIKRYSWMHRENGLEKKLTFARDRLAESFLWALGYSAEPCFIYTREIMTQVAQMVSIIDDIYDLYATLEEIELFTNFIQRWDIKELDNLPLYMQICFLDLNNFVNKFAAHILKEQGLNIIPNIRKLWIELCRSYAVEARWYHSGYYPKTQEYLNNGWISIATPLVLMYGYFCLANPINKEELQSLEQYPAMVHWPAIIIRLADDFGTSMEEIKRGDVPKSIQCYMHETGCTEEEARVYVKKLMYDFYKKMNQEVLTVAKDSLRKLGERALDLVRTSLSFYLLYGDCFGVNPNSETKRNLVSLIVDPIPIS